MQQSAQRGHQHGTRAYTEITRASSAGGPETLLDVLAPDTPTVDASGGQRSDAGVEINAMVDNNILNKQV